MEDLNPASLRLASWPNIIIKSFLGRQLKTF